MATCAVWCLIATLAAAGRLEVKDVAQAKVAVAVSRQRGSSKTEDVEATVDVNLNVIATVNVNSNTKAQVIAAALNEQDPLAAGIDSAKNLIEASVHDDEDEPWEAGASALAACAALAVLIPPPAGLVVSGVLGLMAWGMETRAAHSKEMKQKEFQSQVKEQLAELKEELRAVHQDFTEQFSTLRREFAEHFSHFSLHLNTLEQIIDFFALLEDYRTSTTKRHLLPSKAEDFAARFEVERHGTAAMGPENVRRALEFYEDTCDFFKFYSKVLAARNILAYAMILDAPRRSPGKLEAAFLEVLTNLGEDLRAYDQAITWKLGVKEPHVRRAWMSRNCVLADTMLIHYEVGQLSHQRFSTMEKDSKFKWIQGPQTAAHRGDVQALHFYKGEVFLVQSRPDCDPTCTTGRPDCDPLGRLCPKLYYRGPAAGLLALVGPEDWARELQKDNSVLRDLPHQSGVAGDFLYFIPPDLTLSGNEVVHRCRLPELRSEDCEELDLGFPKIGKVESMAIAGNTLYGLMGSFLTRTPLPNKEGSGRAQARAGGWAHIPRAPLDPHCKTIHIFSSSSLVCAALGPGERNRDVWVAPLTGFLRPDVPQSQWMEEGKSTSSTVGGIQWMKVPRPDFADLQDAWFLSG